MSDVLAVLSWYLISLVIAVAGGLIAFRLFGRLPDRGLGMSRILGLLAVGTFIWWAGNAGVLPNTRPGNIGAILVVLVFGVWLNRHHMPDLLIHIKEQRKFLVILELVFALSFALWAFVRANSPEIVGTEKPMELAFLNAISASDGFPPPDPWLAGFGISYYYFGFVLAGALTQVSGVMPSVAFNLTSAFWFALVVSGAYSLSYNLISARAGRSVFSWPLLGPVLLTLTGNLEGFLEVLHTRHLFWRGSVENGYTSSFWSWLDVKTLVEPPLADPGWLPQRHWWWWRASRVVRDLNLAGVDHEVIDEFPFFSFLLADIHPHVLAIPFALLAIAFAFQLLLAQTESNREPLINLSAERWRSLTLFSNVALGTIILLGQIVSGDSVNAAQAAATSTILRYLVVVGIWLAILNFLLYAIRGKLPLAMSWVEILAGGWIFGSMAFLNTWDFPIYLSLLFFVLLIAEKGLAWRERLISAASTSGAVLLVGVLMFLPWYPSFASQAGGILPNLAFPTKLQHFIVMFAPLYVPIAAWLVWRQRKTGRMDWKTLAIISLGLPLALWVFSWLVAFGVSLAVGPEAIGAGLDLIGVNSTQAAIQAALSRRVARLWTALLMAVTLAFVWLLIGPGSGEKEAGRPRSSLLEPSARFSALLIAIGALLVIGPEYLYLKDLFGTRMNTIFKFYFAGWILWSMAATYVCYEFRPRARHHWARWLIYLPLLLGMFYPVMGLISRTQGFQPSAERTLDGAAYLASSNPSDARAIDWINANQLRGVVAEAVGGSYSQYARIATHTGLSTVLGWEFHEIQWRGSAELQGSRRADVERLYSTSDWSEAQQIIDRYGIDFVYIGPLELSSYGAVRTQKFEAFMEPIYQQGEVFIFAKQSGINLQ